MNTDIASLVGARICHDLISPIGAISNGVELIGMTQGTDGAEMSLINDSVQNANARIRFFRLAFGAATTDQLIGAHDITQVLTDISKGGRITYRWHDAEKLPRTLVRAVFLLLQCLETALPRGGTIDVARSGNGWACTATGTDVRLDEGLWDSLTNQFSRVEHTAAQVQFALLPQAVVDAGMTLSHQQTETALIATLA